MSAARRKPTPKPPKKKEKKYPLPVLLEFIYNTSFMIVALAGIICAAISVMMGSPVLLTLVRVVVTVIVVGVLMWLVSWIVTSGTLKAISTQYRERMEEEEKNNSTVEFEA